MLSLVDQLLVARPLLRRKLGVDLGTHARLDGIEPWPDPRGFVWPTYSYGNLTTDVRLLRMEDVGGRPQFVVAFTETHSCPTWIGTHANGRVDTSTRWDVARRDSPRPGVTPGCTSDRTASSLLARPVNTAGAAANRDGSDDDAEVAAVPRRRTL